jgi:hypothetical protein
LLEKLDGLQDSLFKFLQLIFSVAQEASSFQNCLPRIGSSDHWAIETLTD